MTTRPDAKENRRLGKIETDKAERLNDGAAKKAHLKKAREHEDEAHSNDWRNANLSPPN
jgi:hypothetical protein